MTHALVIGGSGMLSEASLGLTRSFRTVSVVARTSSRLFELQNTNSRIVPIAVDYRSTDKLLTEIRHSVTAHGEIGLVVCWVHDIAPRVPRLVAEVLNGYDIALEFYHILGSSHSRPTAANVELKNSFRDLSNINYNQIILGFVLQNESSRWLTNQEISSGVLRSIESGIANSVVGTVEPWDRRP
jgi:hypothetical protein